MRALRTMLALLTLAALVLAPAAVAKEYAPPGKAGTSEYAEDIPTAGGNVKTPAMGGGNKTAAQIDKLGAGKAGVRKLAELGKTGAAAAQFAQQTAPSVNTQSTSGAGSATTSTTGTGTTPATTAGTGSAAQTGQNSTLNVSGKSALSGVWSTITGSDGDGIGAVLPLLLAFGLGAAATFIALRLRRGERQPPA